jgi:protein TonB
MVGVVISAAIHVAYISLGAGPTSKPYQLRGERKMEVLNIPAESDIRLPPAAVVEPDSETPVVAATPPKPEITQSTQRLERPRRSEPPEKQETVLETTLDPSATSPSVPTTPAEGEYLAFDSPPQLIQAVKPEYPNVALEVHAEGVVHVQVTIDETGRVIEAMVIGSDTIAALEEAALEAARQSRFRPAKQRDVPVKSRISIPFRFKLN